MNWQRLARRPGGDDWATDKLLEQPELSDEAAPYWAAFEELSPYRPKVAMSLGLGGGVTFPDPIPLDLIHEEGRRLRYLGDDLEDFIQIIRGLDRAYLNAEHERIAAGVRAAADKSRR